MQTIQNSRYLIIHADDGGLCYSVNRAIMSALEKGTVSSTSLMAPCPQLEEITDYLKINPQFDLGIHLTLTCEYPNYPWGPVSDKNNVKSLVNPAGYLWHSVKEFIQNAKPEDVETELRAQVECILEAGLQPSHLDSHMGTVFMDLRFLEIYVKLGLEYQITPMLVNPTEHGSELIDRFNFNIEKDVVERLMKSGIPFLNFLYMTDDSTRRLEEREKEYINVINYLPSGVSQIIIHPGYDDEELKKITDNSSSRQYDFSIFINENIKNKIDELGVKLISWKDLAILT
jgi:predicted glycoside hydrolase/deacetylase ChbG (UPF0249 family)